MDDEQLNQRIKYLTEHGGLWDDPLARIRLKLRLLSLLVGVSVLLQVATLLG